MAILNPFISGGGILITKLISGGLTVSSGASGTLVSLTPPAGERVVITNLVSDTGGIEADLSVEVGGTAVISGGTLASGNITGGSSFYVGINNTDTNGAANGILGITGGKNETIDIIKDSGTTSFDIHYQYMFGK
jgi:hypothetical protein